MTIDREIMAAVAWADLVIVRVLRWGILLAVCLGVAWLVMEVMRK